MFQYKKVMFYILLQFGVYQFEIAFASIASIDDDCELFIGTSGKCKLLKNCPTALNEIKLGKQPKICSFQQIEPIVCCQNVIGLIQHSEKISRQKCKKYGESVFELVESPLLEFKNKINVSRCKDNRQIIVSGPNARPGQFPHMALLGYEDNGNINWKCSGVLISDQYILTTAECSHLKSTGPLKQARLGVTNINDENSIQNISISEVVRHPGYKPPMRYNDIALLKLEHPVKIGEYVRPSCLPDLNQKPSERYFVTGWEHQDYLTNYIVNELPHQECTRFYEKNINISIGIDGVTHLCSIPNAEVCAMFSGSAIQNYDKDVYCMYNVQGILSFGKSCQSQTPNIFTKIAPYIDWIENIIWP